ncbi:chemotaxis protein CheW [Treponema sp.]
MMETAGNAYLAFDIADEHYAVDVARVEVVLEMAAITRVPKSARQLRGVINHRGSVVPVVDLRVIFGMEQTLIREGIAVIVTQIEVDNTLITAGFLADAVHEVIDLDTGFVAPPPSFGVRSDGDFVKGIAQRGSDFIILLDLEKAISASVGIERE